MTFVTAANHRFKDHALACVNSIKAHGYPVIIVDLGGLGFGDPITVRDDTFQKTGCYETKFKKWRSRAMHVCSVICYALQRMKKNEILVYVDADTRLLDKIEEIRTMPMLFDVGVTIRPQEEWEALGRANSGVVFVRYNLAALAFMNEWIKNTFETGNIQEGLNLSVKHATCLVAEFPTAIYNNYHEPNNPPPGTKIIHYRASMEDT